MLDKSHLPNRYSYLVFVCCVSTEGGNSENFAKYVKILQILEYDLNALKDINVPSILYGDFNAHIGDTSTKHEIEGNNKRVGKNGQLLHDWLNKWGKVVINNQPITAGKWTWQKGSSTSILDLMIIDQKMVNFIDALIIDDERGVTTTNTDHNTLVSLLNTGYERIKWE